MGLFALADPNSSDAKLDALRKEVEFLIESFGGDSEDPPESLDGSDDLSDLSGSEDPLEDIIGELRTYIRSLIDLAPCLERPAPDANAKELEADPAASSATSGPAEIWCRRVTDRYEGIDRRLAERLGEANWRRFQRVAQRLENANDRNPDDGYCESEEDTVPELPVVLKGTPDQDSLPHTASTFRDSGLGTTIASAPTADSIYSFRALPKTTRTDAASQATYTSALSEEPGDRGWLRVPPLPEGAALKSAFRCTVCGDNIRGIKSRVDWKRHVFADLEPYICTFQDCKGGISTYPSRKLWADHEFSQHRIKKSWACGNCSALFDKRDDFRQHINENHGNFYTETRLEAVIAAAEKRTNQPTEDLTCPFCALSMAPIKRAFAMHVGRHMEEIALGVLPRETDSGDEHGSGSSNQSSSSDVHSLEMSGRSHSIESGEEIDGPEIPLAKESPKADAPDPAFRNYQLNDDFEYEELLSMEFNNTIKDFLATASSRPPFPKLHGTPPNVPLSDEERRYILEDTQSRVLVSGDPQAQLAWAEDAFREARILETQYIKYHHLGNEFDELRECAVKFRECAGDIVYSLADQGHPKGYFLKGLKFKFRNKNEAINCYQQAAKGGYSRAEYRMGKQFEDLREMTEALAHYRRGAELGDSASTHRLGMMALLGQHGERLDYRRGVQLIAQSARSADRGFPQGAYMYGLLLLGDLPSGIIPTSVLERDTAGARQNLERAAYLGFAKAQVTMGQAYELCQLGCDFDPVMSLHYHKLAASQCEPEAEMAISKWFLNGHEGTFERSETMAFDYAIRAAMSNFPPAEFAIGYFYEVGVLVKVNLSQAVWWYERATEHGNQDARTRLEALQQRLAKAQEQTPPIDSAARPSHSEGTT